MGAALIAALGASGAAAQQEAGPEAGETQSAAPEAAPAPATGVRSACPESEWRPAPLQANRHALVIANSAYPEAIGRLEETPRDAKRVCDALEALGFEVIVRIDQDLAGMQKAMSLYADQLDASGDQAVGFFYFSGHGAAQEQDGDNYLIPIDAPIAKSEDLSLYALRLGQVMRRIAGANYARGKANFIVIDACRNVAFERNRNVASRGLKPVPARGGAMIAFSTAPGDVAADAEYFSKSLAEELQVPNRSAYAAFREVRRRVYAETQGDQTPWFEDGLIDEFFFKRDALAGAPAAPPVSEASGPAVTAIAPLSAGRPILRLSGCPNCPELMVIEAGERRDPADGAFAVSLREVTFDDWRACAESGGCAEYVPGDAGWGRGDHPVINVSHQDAERYVRWLAKETGRPFRLLSDQEWTEAAAAGSTARFAHGDDPNGLCRYANGSTHRLFGGLSCSDLRRPGTTPVGRYEPNAFGLYDMAGNVWEWVAGCADGSESEGCVRILRGGSWESGIGALTPQSRRLAVDGYRGPTAGFRVGVDWPLDK